MSTTISRGMESFTVEDFQKHFDELLERVENGESFLITSEYGNAVMIPYGECEEDSAFCNHDDGC
jgi:PHD/YefM family antitoxin component YafN of YafNO toxin-antitoxin module